MRAADLVATIRRDDRAEVTHECDEKSRRIAVRRRDGLADGPGICTARRQVGRKIPGYTNVHAMALDEASHRLFTASLQPGRLTVVDTQSGGVVAALPCVLGVDDIWFDPLQKRIYAPGAGAIDVFQQADPDRYIAVARIQAGAGAGSTSFHLKTRTQDSLFMSWPNMLAQGGAEVLLFYVND
jgi:hypothetical protein